VWSRWLVLRRAIRVPHPQRRQLRRRDGVVRQCRPLPAFQASDSDFGGRPETLFEICEEIVKRGLKLQFGGQIRLNKNSTSTSSRP